jgi:hypothetical protein
MADMKPLGEAAAMEYARHAMTQTPTFTETSSETRPKKQKPQLPHRIVMERMAVLPSTTELQRRQSIWLQAKQNVSPFEYEAQKQIKHELTRIAEQLELAAQRDLLQAERPPECWCLGAGGSNPSWVPRVGENVDRVPMFAVYCSCVDGHLARATAEGAMAEYETEMMPIRRSALLAGIGDPPIPDVRPITLESYRPEPQQRAVYEQIRAAADGPPRSIFLYGEASRGKTGLLYALMTHWVARDLLAGRYWLVTKLVQEITRQSNADIGPGEEDVFLRCQRVPILMIDDLGKQKRTDFRAEKLFDIIAERHSKNLPTLFTSNIRPSDLREEDQLGPYVLDRITQLCGMDWVKELKGANRRVKREAA